MIVRLVVPCYNSENFIRETFVKILEVTNRLKTNCIDVVFVNDGSTDGTGKILDTLTSETSNFLVLHKDNGGEGSARNYGIEFKGRSYDYVYFIDSDDLLLDDFVEAYGHLRADQPDILIASYIQTDLNSGTLIKKYRQRERKYSRTEALEQFLLRNLVPGIGNTFFRKSSIRFSESKLGADSYFVFENLLISNQIIGIGHIVYNYRIRSGSAMSSPSMDNILMAKNILENVGIVYPSLKNAASFFLLNETFGYYQRTKIWYVIDDDLGALKCFFKVSLKKQGKVMLYLVKKWLNC